MTLPDLQRPTVFARDRFRVWTNILKPGKSAAHELLRVLGHAGALRDTQCSRRWHFRAEPLAAIAARPVSQQRLHKFCAGYRSGSSASPTCSLSSLSSTMGQAGGGSDGMTPTDLVVRFCPLPIPSKSSELPITVTLSQHWAKFCGHGLHRSGSGGGQQWMIHKMPGTRLDVHGHARRCRSGSLFRRLRVRADSGISVRKATCLNRCARVDRA